MMNGEATAARAREIQVDGFVYSTTAPEARHSGNPTVEHYARLADEAAAS